MHFHYFVIISPWKRVWPFIWTYLNSNHPRMFCAKCWWNWPSGSREENFLNFVNVFSLFRYYFPLKKGAALHMNKLESPSPKDALCQVWLKLTKRFMRRRWKFMTTTTTDNRQIVIRKAHLSLWLRWAKKALLHGFDLYIYKVLPVL